MNIYVHCNLCAKLTSISYHTFISNRENIRCQFQFRHLITQDFRSSFLYFAIRRNSPDSYECILSTACKKKVTMIWKKWEKEVFPSVVHVHNQGLQCNPIKAQSAGLLLIFKVAGIDLGGWLGDLTLLEVVNKQCI